MVTMLGDGPDYIWDFTTPFRDATLVAAVQTHRLSSATSFTDALAACIRIGVAGIQTSAHMTN